jgi:hypothetical protein
VDQGWPVQSLSLQHWLRYPVLGPFSNDKVARKAKHTV